MIQVNDCNNCIHNKVCLYKNPYNTIIEATKAVTDGLNYDIFKLECKCEHFSAATFNREGVR